MLVERRPFLLRYVIALLSVGTAVAIASLLPWRADPSHFTLFFLAVMVSAWYGGLVAGLVATVLSASSLDFFFIAPIHSIDLNWQALMRLSVFSAVAAITGYLTAARRHAEGALRQHQAVLEERVQERTAELAQANTSLHAEIAERKRAENELFKLQLQMGHVERSATLGRLTGTIAHELGTPLNSVLGYTQLLAQDELSEQARRRLNIIETQIHRMEEIIQHYLSHTRGASPKNEIEINALIRETLVLLQPIFQQRKIAVTAELCDALPTTQGDSISLRRVLINLINNSLDASAEGTIEITDCGIGIPKEILPKIFDLFVTTKPFGKGTGLGLDICQEIIKAHGGTIHITSEVGQGTTVSIHLPAGGSTADLGVSEANL
jgi:signal transduction histidine kinase